MLTFKTISLILLTVLAISNAGLCQTEVTMSEANQVASKWLQVVQDKKGDWAGGQNPFVDGVELFQKADLVVGYLCRIHPEGIIVVSRYKELTPVQFYSDKGIFTADTNKGLPLFLKDFMAQLVTNLQNLAVKSGTTMPSALQKELEMDFSPVWNFLLGLESKSGEAAEEIDYQEGEILLSSEWHQHAPYNEDCPYLGCDNTTNGNALVGCVATAGSQIMRYWNWPPYGSGAPYNDRYDWPNMMDTVSTSAPQVQINAVAELNHEVGLAVDMKYGCKLSGIPTDRVSDIVDLFEDHYRYSTACRIIESEDYSHDSWFEIMKHEFNNNRPVQYVIPGHSIVLDGWEEYYVYPSTIKNVHVNYGSRWGVNSGWFTLYSIPGGNPDDEYMVENIYPAQSLSSVISGTYYRASFPYRYVAWDTTSSSATFQAGQRIQFLPEVTLKCTSSSGSIVIEGTTSYNTLLFANGDESVGIRILNGEIRVTNQGEIMFR